MNWIIANQTIFKSFEKYHTMLGSRLLIHLQFKHEIQKKTHQYTHLQIHETTNFN